MLSKEIFGIVKKELKIEKLDHYGRGIGKINNKTVFVNNALEDEIVEITVTKEKKNFCEAEVVKYIKTSEKRQKPICPYYNFCGGCQLQHLSYSEQLKFKENKVKEVLNKFASINENIIKPIIKSENEYYYRNKITLQVDKKVGLYKEKSNDIVPIEHCYLVSEGINDSIKDIQKENFSSLKGNIVIKETTLKDKLISYNLNKSITNEKEYVLEQMENFVFKISPTSFFQVNTNQAIKLYQKVREYADLKGNEVAKIRNKKMGFVYQNFNLLPKLSAVENVALPLMYSGDNKIDYMKKAKEYLELVGLGDKVHNKPTQLSGGQQQRVAIARALVNNPKILFADEPTGALDSRTSDDIVNLIKKVWKEQGITVIMVTHDDALAKEANRVIRVADGKILE